MRWATAICRLLVAACAFAGRAAYAWDVAVVPEDGELRAGRAVVVRVAVVDDAWAPVEDGYSVQVDGGLAVKLGPDGPPGVVRWAVIAPSQREEARVVVSRGGERRTVLLPIGLDVPAALDVEGIVTLEPGRREVALRVQPAAPMDVEALEVSSVGAEVTSVRPQGGDLLVTLRLAGGDAARIVPVVLSDRRGEALPVVVRLRVPGTVSVPMTTEPGARVELRIGERTPWVTVAGPDGQARFDVVHHADDVAARVRVEDAAGNAVLRDVELSRAPPVVLVGNVLSAWWSREAPPPVVVQAFDRRGQPWRSGAPTCRTPRIGEVPLVAVLPGVWVVPLPPGVRPDLGETRVRCEAAGAAPIELVVKNGPSVPERLSLRLFPEELSSDFPVSDVAVSLLDADGLPLPFTGEVQFSAALGHVEPGPETRAQGRAEYRGQLAAEAGTDRVKAAWYAPAGSGLVRSLALTAADATDDTRLDIEVVVRDPDRRGVAGVPVVLRLQGKEQTATSDARGRARWTVETSGTVPFLPYEIRADAAVADGVLVAGSRWGTPGGPDLMAEVPVRLSPGRLASVEVEVVPGRLATGTGKSAEVVARFLDRAGMPASQGLPTLEASEGTLVPLDATADGAYRWAFTPRGSFRERDVTFIARSEVLDVEGRTELEVRSAPVRWFVGLDAGVHTNLAAWTSSAFQLESGGRIRLRPDEREDTLARSRVFLVGGVGWFGSTERFPLTEGGEGAIRMDVLPTALQIQLRQEMPTYAAFVGAGLQAAPWVGSYRIDDGAPLVRGVGMLPPGVVGHAGVAVRVVGGELTLQLRASSLRSVGTPTSVSGWIGGLSMAVGYRVLQ